MNSILNFQEIKLSNSSPSKSHLNFKINKNYENYRPLTTTNHNNKKSKLNSKQIKSPLFYIQKSALEINTDKFVNIKKKTNKKEDDYEIEKLLIDSEELNRKRKSTIISYFQENNNKEIIKYKRNLFSLMKVMKIIEKKEKNKENEIYVKAENLLKLKKDIKNQIERLLYEKEKKMVVKNKMVPNIIDQKQLNIEKKNLENEHLLNRLNIKVKENPFIDYHIKEIKEIKKLFTSENSSIQKQHQLLTQENQPQYKLKFMSNRSVKSIKSMKSIRKSKNSIISLISRNSNKVTKQIDKLYLSDSEEEPEQEFIYKPTELKLQKYPNEIQKIITHQNNLLNKDNINNNTEIYNSIELLTKINNSFTKTIENNITTDKISNNKRGLFFKKDDFNPKSTNSDKIRSAFRFGIQEGKPKERIINVRLYEHPNLKLSKLRKRLHEKNDKLSSSYMNLLMGSIYKNVKKDKYKSINEIYIKTKKYIEGNFNPIIHTMDINNKTARNALNRDNKLKSVEPFNLADKMKFSQKYQICYSYNEKKREYESNYINKITSRTNLLENEITDQVQIDNKYFQENLYSQKIEKWRKCIITAAIHFKKLNCSLEDFFSLKKISNQPYSNESSWMFIQAIKNGEIKNVIKLIEENKFLVHDFDNHKQTPLHWAIKRKHNKIAKILIQNGAPIDFKSSTGRTPLHISAENDNADGCIILLKEMADPLIKDNLGFTPSQLTKNKGIIYYLNRIKALYIIYSGLKRKDAYEKIKNGINFLFMHEKMH